MDFDIITYNSSEIASYQHESLAHPSSADIITGTMSSEDFREWRCGSVIYRTFVETLVNVLESHIQLRFMFRIEITYLCIFLLS